MVEAGTQRKNIQILTGIGFIISIGLLIFFKQHPTYFQVGGIFQSSLGQLGFFAPLIFVLLQVIQVVLSDYSWWDDKCYWLHCIWTYLGIYL